MKMELSGHLMSWHDFGEYAGAISTKKTAIGSDNHKASPTPQFGTDSTQIWPQNLYQFYYDFFHNKQDGVTTTLLSHATSHPSTKLNYQS